MPRSLFALRRVKYRSLPHLFDKRILVSRLGRIEKDVLGQLALDTGNFQLKSSPNNIELKMKTASGAAWRS